MTSDTEYGAQVNTLFYITCTFANNTTWLYDHEYNIMKEATSLCSEIDLLIR